MRRTELAKRRLDLALTILAIATIFGFAIVIMWIWMLILVSPTGWVMVGEPFFPVRLVETILIIIGVVVMAWFIFFGAYWTMIKRKAKRARV